jgi:hypothetical protein
LGIVHELAVNCALSRVEDRPVGSILHGMEAFLVFLVATLVAISGFAFAELIRLYAGPPLLGLVRWLHLFPEYQVGPLLPAFRLAWLVGVAVYLMNVGAMALQQSTGFVFPLPGQNMDLSDAVLVYPLICVVQWPFLLRARHLLRGGW